MSPPEDRMRLLDAVERLLTQPPHRELSAQMFLGRQFDEGLAWTHFRVGVGGLGLASSFQSLVDERMEAVGAPIAFHLNPLGVGMVAPAIHEHGAVQQCRRLLRPLYTGEEIWCQLFSEPGAGSDLAAVATRAIRTSNGDWLINGQKVWTSYAHKARWGLLLARSDPEVPKHRGLTTYVVDMKAPGVEVRPLYQMTGDAEFNEVYFNNVRLEDANRLGPIGDGWRVVLTTLLNERIAIGGRAPDRGGGLIAEALRSWAASAEHRPAMRYELVRLWMRAEVLRITNARAALTREAESGPGPKGWISKVMSAELNIDIASFLVDQLGPEGLLKPGGYPMRRATRSPFDFGGAQHEFLRARANTIEGGTSEVARNVLAERVLGLPPEPRTDKDVPFNQLTRG